MTGNIPIFFLAEEFEDESHSWCKAWQTHEGTKMILNGRVLKDGTQRFGMITMYKWAFINNELGLTLPSFYLISVRLF